MLTGLHIKDYAIVESLDLDLKTGMTVITGETGAGKSIMIDALGLVLGGRADSQSIRPGAERCDISASFDIQHLPQAQHFLAEHDLTSEGECLLRRTIATDGRSKGFINQHPVTMSQLKSLGEVLIHIHSQHAQQLLLQSEHQRHWLDAFGKHAPLLKKISTLSTQYHRAAMELKSLQANVGNPDQIALLRYQLDELDELNLAPGEFESLELTFKNASKAEQTLSVIQQTEILLSAGDHNLISMLHQTQRLLAGIKLPSAELASIQNCLAAATVQCDEANLQLEEYRSSVALDPESLREIEQRVEKIHAMSRKHHCEPEQLAETHAALKERLFALENSEEATRGLEASLETLRSEYQTVADDLTKLRQKSSTAFSKKIEAHLHQLGMPKGEVSIKVTADPQALPTAQGQDKIDFLVRTNPGLPLNSLAKVVSGGELSRISLAIQVIAAERDHTPTIIFDEVDVGIGGSTAAVVGRLLRELGKSTQVICVTHQPQVAACGDHHLRVEKISGKQSTTSKIEVLAHAERVDEIARMLGGLKITTKTTEHAESLMAEAILD